MTLPIWLLFTLLTFLASVPFYLSLRNIVKEEPGKLESLVRRMFWIPGVVAIGFRAYTGEGFEDVSFGLGQIPWLFLLAWLMPLAMEILVVFFATRFGLTRLDPSLIQFRAGKVHVSQSIQLLLGHEPQSYFKFSLNLLATVSAGILLMLVFSFAEEFGWRGFLQTPLIQTFGLGSGLMLGGVLWGLWHAPIILAGYRFTEYPRLAAFVYWPIFTICLAIITGWLYWQSGSLWPAVLFNASVKVNGRLASAALGEAGDSRRVRAVWLWLWATLAVFFLALWQVGGIGNL